MGIFDGLSGILDSGNHDSILGNIGKQFQKYTDPLAMIGGDKYVNLTSVEIPRLVNTGLSKVVTPFDRVDETINPVRRYVPFVDKVGDVVRDKPGSAIGTAAGAFFGGGALLGAAGAGGAGGGAASTGLGAEGAAGASGSTGMFDLNTLFNTAGTQGYLGGMGGGSPAGDGGFLGLADSINGSQGLSLDPSVLQGIGKMASTGQQVTPQRAAGGGLGSRLSAGQITDPTQAILAQRKGDGDRKGLAQLLYGR